MHKVGQDPDHSTCMYGYNARQIQAYYQQSFIFRITRRAVGVCAYTRNAAAGRATRVGRRAPEPLLHASHSGIIQRGLGTRLVSRGVGQALRASIIAESAQRRQYVFPLTRFAAWYRVSADFANLSKFSSCS